MGQVFQVQYILKIFIQHEGFFERGSGSHVSLPLRILATPRTEPSQEPWRIPGVWNPCQGTEHPTYVYLANPDEKPEYMTKFIDRNWAKWQANLAPVLLANQQANESRAKRSRLSQRSKSVGNVLRQPREGAVRGNDEDSDGGYDDGGTPGTAQNAVLQDIGQPDYMAFETEQSMAG